VKFRSFSDWLLRKPTPGSNGGVKHGILHNSSRAGQLLSFMNSLPDAVVLLDSHGKVQLANDAFSDLLRSSGEVLGKSLAEVLPVRGSTALVNLIELTNGGDKPVRRRGFTVTSAAGAEVSLEITVTPSPERERHYFVLLKDITNEKSLDQQRQEFISVAAHELRTPLSITEAALSSMLLISKDQMKPEAVNLAEQAQRNIVFLSALVKDLTTLAEAQQDSLVVEIKPMSAANLIEQVYDDFLPVATEKGLKLTKHFLSNLPTVLTTEHFVREILENLVSNGIKYTDHGSVSISAVPTPAGGLLFSVSDTGIGISAANQAKLFTKFFRAEDYQTRQTGGTGLGLYLCLELANRISAHLWAQSKLHQGSTFYLEVPPVSRLAKDSGQIVQAKVNSLVDQL